MAVILVTAVTVNVVVNLRYSHLSDQFPFIGAAVWVAILACVPVRRPHWEELRGAFRPATAGAPASQV